MRWECTTVLRVEAVADTGQRGLGFSYCSAAAADIMREMLAPAIVGCDALNTGMALDRMVAAVRNIGRPGVAATAISAVDIALWDLEARAADLPLWRLLGARRTEVPIYGSGGFTSYSMAELADQLGAWAVQAFRV